MQPLMPLADVSEKIKKNEEITTVTLESKSEAKPS